ncbi:MAG: hypothetical protein H0U76_12655 [Ktedonobacteraceae bacterium]|nr:hypothetical protein [Ktedonobacteraceae bacterium]
MKFSGPLVYANLAALAVNTIIVWLTLVKAFPPVLGVSIFLVFLASTIWLSCYLNGQLPKKARPPSFYAARTEKTRRV